MSEAADHKPRLSLALPSKKKKAKKAAPAAASVREAFGRDAPSVNAPVEDHLPKEPLVIPAEPNKFGGAASYNQKKKGQEEVWQDAADAEALQVLRAQAAGDDEESPKEGGNRKKDIVIQSSANTFQRDSQQFKADLDALPQELSSEDYARKVPIADFGAALLRGMGWRGDDEGSSSRNKKNNADDIMPRPQRLGLGAVPKMEAFPDTSSRKRSLRPDQVKQRERLEDQQKEYARERERQVALDKQRTMQNGSLIALRSGGGARAKIIQLVGVPGLNMVKVWPEGDTATSVVKRAEIEGLLTREELEDRPYREPKIEKPKKEVEKDRGSSDQKKERKEKRRREEEEASRRSKDRSSKRPREESERRMVWAIPNIRVRVITERLGRRYFKEKGIIVDVTVKGVTLRLDKSGTVLDRVPEDYLETALPKPGGKVIVLAGRNKYAKGKLLERDSKSSKGVVQIYEELNVLSLSLDDLAEWVGSLDDDME